MPASPLLSVLSIVNVPVSVKVCTLKVPSIVTSPPVAVMWSRIVVAVVVVAVVAVVVVDIVIVEVVVVEGVVVDVVVAMSTASMAACSFT